MRKTQRRILGAMLQLADNDMKVDATVSEISAQAGIVSGGMVSDAIELLEYHNKITRLGGGHKWQVTV